MKSNLSHRNIAILAIAGIVASVLIAAAPIDWSQASAALQAQRNPAASKAAPNIVVGSFVPTKIYFFNDNTELTSTTSVAAASLTYASSATNHRLKIDFTATGAIKNETSNGALLFVGCFIDGTKPCVGNQSDPATTPAGYVNLMSTNYPNHAAWDNGIAYTWWTNSLGSGTHTVTIKAAVGNPLVPYGDTGELFIEARNMVVTVAVPT